LLTIINTNLFIQYPSISLPWFLRNPKKVKVLEENYNMAPHITRLAACTAVRGKQDYDEVAEDFRFPLESKTYIYLEMGDVAKGGKISWLFYRKIAGKWEYTHTGEWVIPEDWSTCWASCWKTNWVAGEKLCEIYYNGVLVGKKTYYAGPEEIPEKIRRLIGTVKDKSTGTVIEGVKVQGAGLTVYTNVEGKYIMNQPNLGSQTIAATFTGYKGLTKSVTIPEEGMVTLNFDLELEEVVPEYKVLPEPPAEWTEEAKNLYKRLDEACYMKDKVAIFDVLKAMLEVEMSPAPLLAAVLAITGIISIIIAIVGTYPFSSFLYEETLQTIDMAVYAAMESGDWALAAKALAKKEEILEVTLTEKILAAIPFLNVVAAANKFIEVSRFKLGVDQELVSKKQAAAAPPTQGDLEEAAKAIEEGRDPTPYLPNASQLIINSDPSGAGLEVKELAMTYCCTPFRFIPISPGTYTVKVFLEGYISQEKIIPVYEGRISEETFYLKTEAPPERASIEVITRPDGADVFVNDVLFTYPSNTVIGDLDAGAYQIRVEKTGYESAEKRITVGEGEHRKTEFELVPIEVPTEKGILAARSSPSGAEVIIDEKVVTTTPGEVELDPGSYSVTFKLDGYKDLTRTTIVKKGETVVLSVTLVEEDEEEPTPPLPPPGKAHIVIDVTPDYAELWLGATLLGTLPPPGHYETDMDPGSYDFTFKKAGYYETTRTAILRSDQTTILSVSLIRIPEKKKVWRVDVSAVDSDGYSLSAKILVNDSFTGKWTPDYILLDPGDYVFKITKSGYYPAEIPLSLEAIE